VKKLGDTGESMGAEPWVRGCCRSLPALEYQSEAARVWALAAMTRLASSFFSSSCKLYIHGSIITFIFMEVEL
jgi:hypothetical protein